MLKDLIVEQEPKGVSVPVAQPVAEPIKTKVSRPYVKPPHDRLLPSKRLKSRHRRIGTYIPLKEWVGTLNASDPDSAVAEQWYKNKRR